jgi:tetratricopeptide (TPR) repeat protein
VVGDSNLGILSLDDSPLSNPDDKSNETSKDAPTKYNIPPSVAINILQGEREFAKDNRLLGSFILDGLQPSQPSQIEITFDIDLNDILNVWARDKATGREKKITISPSSGLTRDQVDRMTNDAELYVLKDKLRKENAEERYAAESICSLAEKSIAELGEMLTLEQKNLLALRIEKVRSALATDQIDDVKSSREGLEQVLGPEHPEMAGILVNLGLFYQDQGQYEQAEPLYQRVLAIREKVLGPEHLDTARSLDNLAILYHNQLQYAKAEPLYQRALTIYEKVLGAEHPDTARTLDNLGLLPQGQGGLEGADAGYRQASAILHLWGAAELEDFITMKGDDPAHDDAVRRRVVESQILALGAPDQDTPGLVHLLHCTGPVGDTTVAMLPVFTRLEHVETAVQMNPSWQSFQVLQMDGSAVLGDLEEGECLGINVWSGHEFKLTAPPSTNLPSAR